MNLPQFQPVSDRKALAEDRGLHSMAPEFDKLEAERKAMGAAGHHQVFQAVDDVNDVTAWHDFATLEKARSFASSNELKEAMGRSARQARDLVRRRGAL